MPRTILAIASTLFVVLSSPASADVIDDFTHPLPTGGYRADTVSGVGGGSQSGIPTFRVIGGSRETTITATLPAVTETLVDTPVFSELELLTSQNSGGSLELHYIPPFPYDATLGGGAVIEVQVSRMVAGASLRVILEDGSSNVGAAALVTTLFAATPGTAFATYYFAVDTATFGTLVDLTSIRHIRVALLDTAPGLYIFSDILIEPIATTTVTWSDAFTLETQGGSENPLVLYGFNPQPDPPGQDPFLDLSDATQAKLQITGTSAPSFEVWLAVGGVQPQPFTIDPTGQLNTGQFEFGFENGASFVATLSVEASSGDLVPGSWVWFNPQPDPPGTPDDWIGFSFDVTGGSPQDVTVVLEISESGMPLSMGIPVSVPSLSFWGWVLLASGFAEIARRGLTRRSSST